LENKPSKSTILIADTEKVQTVLKICTIKIIKSLTDLTPYCGIQGMQSQQLLLSSIATILDVFSEISLRI